MGGESQGQKLKDYLEDGRPGREKNKYRLPLDIEDLKLIRNRGFAARGLRHLEKQNSRPCSRGVFQF